MLTDADVSHGLEPVFPLSFAKMPYEGTWMAPPFQRRNVGDRTFAVLCVDPGVQELLIDVDAERIYTYRLDTSELFLVNSSLATLVACSLAYQDAVRAAGANASANLEAIAEALRTKLCSLDPHATDDEDRSLWLVAAEELGYGL